MGNADVGMIDPSLIRSAQASRSVLPGSRIRGPTRRRCRGSRTGVNGAGRPPISGTHMPLRDHLLRFLPLLSLVMMSAQSATVTLKEVKQTGFYKTGWEITSVQANPAELQFGTGMISYYSIYIRMNFTGIYPICRSQSPTPLECLYGRMPPAGGCTSGEQAVQQFQQLVGYGISTNAKGPPYEVQFWCPKTGSYDSAWYLAASVNTTPAPISCATSDAQLTIRGRVGERAKATTELRIVCDTPATVRLTLSDGGLVPVGGEGQVRLLFGKNGRDVLDVSGIAPLVEIEGELIKSPTTAGTYRGSSVLRLDIL